MSSAEGLFLWHTLLAEGPAEGREWRCRRGRRRFPGLVWWRPQKPDFAAFSPQKWLQRSEEAEAGRSVHAGLQLLFALRSLSPQ